MGIINKIKKGVTKKLTPPKNMPKDVASKFKFWNPDDKKSAMIAEKKITMARLALIEKTPFFGRMTLLLEVEPDPLTPTMGTDGEYLFYNPHFVNDMMTQPQLVGTILHEVLHCALLHPWRKEKRNHFKWNMAADYVINPMVKEHNLQLPEGVLYDPKYADLSAEKVYDMLPDPKEIKIGGAGGGDWSSDKSRWGKERREQKGKGKGKGKDKKDSKSGSGSGKSNSKGGKDKKKGNGSGESGKDRQKRLQKQWEGKNKDLMDKLKDKGKGKGKGQKLEDFWKGVFESAMRGTDIGQLPGYLKRLWKELQPKKDWKKLLANYLSVSTDDFNFSTPDRRFLDEDFMLPDLYTEENLEDVVIAVDTSGSISTWQFNHFMTEVKEILDSFPQFKGWLIQCDWDIQNVFEIRPGKDFSPQFRGGGGTNFDPVFKHIEKESLNPRVLIYLTDGYGYFPDKEPDYPTIWLIDSDVEPPFGDRIQYEYDPDDKQDV